MLYNGGVLGKYSPPSTAWTGGVTDIGSYGIAKSANRFMDERHVYPTATETHNPYPLSAWTSKSIASMGEGTTTGLFMKPDGTKIFLIGTTLDQIRQATLSTPYDITTMGTITGQAMTVGLTMSTPQSLSISPDGTKLFVLNTATDTIYSYTLSTPWDVQTLTYDTKTFVTTTQEATPNSFYVKPDGTKFWVVGGTADTIFEYTMSTAWDLATAAYASISYAVGVRDSVPYSVCWNSDGTYFYIMGSTGDKVFEFSASSPWTVASAAFIGSTDILGDITILASGAESTPIGLWLAPGTQHWYFVGQTRDTIFQMKSTITDRIDITYYITAPRSFIANTSCTALQATPDGKKLFYSRNGFGMYEVACPTPFSLLGATATTQHKSVVGVGAIAPEVSYVNKMSRDGKYLYTFAATDDYIAQYRLEEAWNPSSAVFVGTTSFASTTLYDMDFSPDGTTLYMATAAANLYKRTLSTPWDITTRSSTTVVAFANITTYLPSTCTVSGLHLSLDGKVLHLTDSTNLSVYKFIFDSGYNTNANVTHFSYSEISRMGLAQPRGIVVSPDDATILVTDTTNSRIYEFALRTDTL